LLDAVGHIHPYEHLAAEVTFATSTAYFTIRVFGMQVPVENCDDSYAGQLIFYFLRRTTNCLITARTLAKLLYLWIKPD
jgi:hypothetical protein